MKNLLGSAVILIVGLAIGLILPKYLGGEKNTILIYALQNKKDPSKVVVSIQILENSEAWLAYRFSLENKGKDAILAGFSDEEWSSLALESQRPKHFNASADFENSFRLRYVEPE
ncbi:MAG: hypothetical protein HYY55_02300 [Candidatus Niyogibacteria bacterium]|nr:MAG: hypothetical protein HYY55_02300 [Candidatus Niyogibacteria bacterium]